LEHQEQFVQQLIKERDEQEQYVQQLIKERDEREQDLQQTAPSSEDLQSVSTQSSEDFLQLGHGNQKSKTDKQVLAERDEQWRQQWDLREQEFQRQLKEQQLIKETQHYEQLQQQLSKNPELRRDNLNILPPLLG
jgi:hypothetical protein